MSHDGDSGLVRPPPASLAVEQQRAARLHGQHRGARLAHHGDRVEPHHRHVEQQCSRRRATFTSVSAPPVHQAAARRSMASVPSIASTATQARSQMATLWPTSKPASALATRRPYSISAALPYPACAGSSRPSPPAAASAAWSNRAVECLRLPASSPRRRSAHRYSSRAAPPAVSPAASPAGSRRRSWRASPARTSPLRVMPSCLQNLDQLAQLPERNPMAARRQRLDFLRRLFLDARSPRPRGPAAARFPAPAAGSGRSRRSARSAST